MIRAGKLCARGVACVSIGLVFCLTIWCSCALVVTIGNYFHTHANPWRNEDLFVLFFLPLAFLLIIGVCQVSLIYGACREVYLFCQKPQVRDPERQAILDPANSAANLPPYDGTKVSFQGINASEKEGLNQ